MLHRGVLQVLALSSIVCDIECFHQKLPAFVNAAASINNNNRYHARDAKSSSCLASTVADMTTTAIPGMKPGTSGLRKKVEVWQGIDDDSNKNYVENFIQSLIDTAKEANGGEMLHT